MPPLRPAVFGAGVFGFLLSFELLRSLFLRGRDHDADLQLGEGRLAAVAGPDHFSLATIALAVTLPVMGLFFWFLFVKLDTR